MIEICTFHRVKAFWPVFQMGNMLWYMLLRELFWANFGALSMSLRWQKAASTPPGSSNALEAKNLTSIPWWFQSLKCVFSENGNTQYITWNEIAMFKRSLACFALELFEEIWQGDGTITVLSAWKRWAAKTTSVAFQKDKLFSGAVLKSASDSRATLRLSESSWGFYQLVLFF